MIIKATELVVGDRISNGVVTDVTIVTNNGYGLYADITVVDRNGNTETFRKSDRAKYSPYNRDGRVRA